jgi:hypothetical protein
MMRSRQTLRIGLLATLAAGLLGASEVKSAPRLTVQNPTTLYLMAEFKVALGDTNSGLELLDRALAGGESAAPRPARVIACNLSNP